MIRTFIAFELKNQKTIENIKDFGSRLKRNQDKIKIVEPENLHLTVKFLGDIDESTAPEIYKILKEEINEKMFQNKTFEYVLKGVGQFRNYSVLWIQLNGDVQFLQSVKDAVERLLNANLKIERDNRPKFEPHLTIGRLDSKKVNRNTFDKFKKLISENKDLEFGSFEISEIKLKKSVLTPKGPIYSDLVY